MALHQKNDSLLRPLKQKFGVEARVSLPASQRRSRGDPKKLTAIGQRVQTLREDYGMTIEAIASEVNDRLGTRFVAPSVYNWQHSGSTPRKVSPEVVERTLDAIMDEREAVEGGAWVDADEVTATVNRWREHLSVRQIAVAADEHPSTVRSWSTGHHRVLRDKWNRVVPKVEDALKLTAPSQEK